MIITGNKPVDAEIAAFEGHKADRGTWETNWQEVAENLHPRKADFNTAYEKGSKARDNKVMDTSPEDTLVRFASGMHNHLTPNGVPWFLMETEDKPLMRKRKVAMWLEDVNRRMNAAFANHPFNFHATAHEYYTELGAFGNGVIITETRGRNLLYRAAPLAECYFSENEMGVVDTIYRLMGNWTARKIAERFGGGNRTLPAKVRAALSDPKRATDLFQVLWCCKPRPGGPKGFFKAFTSTYIFFETKELLEDGVGFDEFPATVSRWSKNPGETYGRGPGSYALPDIKMLYAIERAGLKLIQKMADPPLLMPDQGFLTPPRTAPGSVNYFRAGTSKDDRIATLNIEGRPDLLEGKAGQARDRIRRAFYMDLLELPGPTAADGDVQRFTATEIQMRQMDRLPILAPLVARQEHEFLGPLVLRTASLMVRLGLLPEPPQELLEAGFKVVYVNPVSVAMRARDLQAFAAHQQAIAPMLQANPGLVDLYDGEEIFRGAADVLHLPASYIRSPQSLARLRSNQEQAAQQQFQAEQAQALADAQEKTTRSTLNTAKAAQAASEAAA